MSNSPTGLWPTDFTTSPTLTFNYILRSAEKIKPGNRAAILKPHLEAFLHNPLIKDILEQDKTPAPLQPPPPSNALELKKIQDTLTQLAKAIETLKSAPTPKPQQKASNQSACTSGPPPKPTTHTFMAIAEARPPNPSLVVDLASLGISQKNQVKLDHLCHALNQGLHTISPP